MSSIPASITCYNTPPPVYKTIRSSRNDLWSCILQKDTRQALRRLQEHPSQAAVPQGGGRVYPLHVALEYSLDPVLLTRLVLAYPPAVRIAYQTKWPLYTHLDRLRLLLVDQKWTTPLHELTLVLILHSPHKVRQSYSSQNPQLPRSIRNMLDASSAFWKAAQIEAATRVQLANPTARSVASTDVLLDLDLSSITSVPTSIFHPTHATKPTTTLSSLQKKLQRQTACRQLVHSTLSWTRRQQASLLQQQENDDETSTLVVETVDNNDNNNEDCIDSINDDDDAITYCSVADYLQRVTHLTGYTFHPATVRAWNQCNGVDDSGDGRCVQYEGGNDDIHTKDAPPVLVSTTPTTVTPSSIAKPITVPTKSKWTTNTTSSCFAPTNKPMQITVNAPSSLERTTKKIATPTKTAWAAAATINTSSCFVPTIMVPVVTPPSSSSSSMEKEALPKTPTKMTWTTTTNTASCFAPPTKTFRPGTSSSFVKPRAFRSETPVGCFVPYAQTPVESSESTTTTPMVMVVPMTTPPKRRASSSSFSPSLPDIPEEGDEYNEPPH